MKNTLLALAVIGTPIVAEAQALDFKTEYVSTFGDDQFIFATFDALPPRQFKFDFGGRTYDAGLVNLSYGVGTNTSRNIPAYALNGDWMWRPALSKADANGHRSYGYVGVRFSLIGSQDDKFSIDDVSGRFGLMLGVEF